MSTQKTARQRADTVEENAVRIDTEKAEQIVDALNRDLASTYVLYHQVRKHHWNVEGAESGDLHDFLGDAAETLEDHADSIAERAQALGGVPVSGPAAQEEHAYVEFEGEDVYAIRDSLEADLDSYGDVIENVREHIGLATDLGDYATAELLREVLEDLEDDAHHIDHYLENDTLVQE
ncbi:DNA starvation/stationary phase protection protein [Halolamina sp. CBA1230]|uniref:DNA starvation/stationary phase protection protein DpsA n=1 Tax=Halolamina sp. CBA1230 TaxID=1853690 RepID=UPI0009A1D409|nr:DNA starvation/stationary phase protection protein DpsA [Halolamina sp. CBA1230]QKY19902.1 DNA starvation/stationary phase protection protein [Halolamina sp. CBA1230]